MEKTICAYVGTIIPYHIAQLFYIPFLVYVFSSESEHARAELAEQISAEQKVKSDLETNLKHIEEEMSKIKSDKEQAELK